MSGIHIILHNHKDIFESISNNQPSSKEAKCHTSDKNLNKYPELIKASKHYQSIT